MVVGMGLLVAFACRPAPRTEGIIELSPIERAQPGRASAGASEPRIVGADASRVAGGRDGSIADWRTMSRHCVDSEDAVEREVRSCAPTGTPPRRAARDPADDDGRAAEHGIPDSTPTCPGGIDPTGCWRSSRRSPASSWSRTSIPTPTRWRACSGIKALVEAAQPGKPVILTVDGMIARSENRAMVELIPIPLVPVETVNIDAGDRGGHGRHPAPHRPPGQRGGHAPGGHRPPRDRAASSSGVLFRDIRTHLGATSTMVTGYLLEQHVMVTPPLATALLYGIESETMGYPREASSLDDGALIWLFPRADKDLLARIRNPKLPQSHFATFQHALANAFLYDKLVVSWCGAVTQPDIIAEIADFFIRFDQVNWALAAGVFENQMKLSLRAGQLGGRCGRGPPGGRQRPGERRRPRQAGRRRDRR